MLYTLSVLYLATTFHGSDSQQWWAQALCGSENTDSFCSDVWMALVLSLLACLPYYALPPKSLQLDWVYVHFLQADCAFTSVTDKWTTFWIVGISATTHTTVETHRLHL